MKKENVIIIFYVMYFTWLFTVVFLTPSLNILNYFTASVTIFYFFLLREKGDLGWFWSAALIPLIIAVVSFNKWQFSFDIDMIYFTPLWLPLSFGITVVALRKFYILIIN